MYLLPAANLIRQASCFSLVQSLNLDYIERSQIYITHLQKAGLAMLSVRRGLNSFFVFIVIFIGGVQAGQAQNTIHVPADVPGIQLAIFSANNGDTIVVAPGTYFENINFFAKAVTIVSSDGPAVTTINANGGTAVAFEQFEGNGSVLRGFTITGATNGGVVATFASPIIEKNIITGNTGCGNGAGIAVSSSAAIVRNNVITNNQGFCSTAGAGIWIQGTPPGTDNPRILNNTITLNQTDGNGAGIALLGGTRP